MRLASFGDFSLDKFQQIYLFHFKFLSSACHVFCLHRISIDCPPKTSSTGMSASSIFTLCCRNSSLDQFLTERCGYFSAACLLERIAVVSQAASRNLHWMVHHVRLVWVLRLGPVYGSTKTLFNNWDIYLPEPGTQQLTR